MSDFRKLMTHKTNQDPRWIQYEKLYENYLTREKTPKIPKIIHLIWLGTLPEHYQKSIQSIKDFHPDWEVILWDENKIKEYGTLINQTLYNKSENLASKSDIFRYEVLYTIGGIYLDLDFEMVKSFDDKLRSLDFFAGFGHVDEPQIFNSLMGCSIGDEIMGKIVYGLKEQKAATKTNVEGIMDSTGPYYNRRILFEYLDNHKIDEINAVIFPTVYFFPYPATQRYVTRYKEDQKNYHKYIHSYVKPETYCIHLWHTSWQK